MIRDQGQIHRLAADGRAEVVEQRTSTVGDDTLREAVREKDFWLLAGSFFVCGASTNGLIGTQLIPAAFDCGIPEARAAGESEGLERALLVAEGGQLDSLPPALGTLDLVIAGRSLRPLGLGFGAWRCTPSTSASDMVAKSGRETNVARVSSTVDSGVVITQRTPVGVFASAIVRSWSRGRVWSQWE
mgnify:CR=1 FL=1